MININISGHNKAPPLVLFHGWGFDSTIWQPLLVPLAKNFKLYCVDLPGFGATAQLNWENFKELLLKQLPSQFAVLGWSLGGLYAIKLASEEPKRCSHFISIASSPCFIQKQGWPGISIEVLNEFYTQLCHEPIQILAHFHKLQKNEYNVNTQNIPSKVALKSGLDCLLNWDLRNVLANLNCPSCFIFGRLDAIIPFATHAEMLNRYPHFQYRIFRKSAHLPFLSETELFINTLQDFIQ